MLIRTLALPYLLKACLELFGISTLGYVIINISLTNFVEMRYEIVQVEIVLLLFPLQLRIQLLDALRLRGHFADELGDVIVTFRPVICVTVSLRQDFSKFCM